MSRVIAGVLVLGMVFSSAALAQPPDAEPEPGMQQQIHARAVERLQRRLQKLQSQLARATNDQARATERRTRLEEGVAALQTYIQQIEQNPALTEALGELIGGGRERD